MFEGRPTSAWFRGMPDRTLEGSPAPRACLHLFQAQPPAPVSGTFMNREENRLRELKAARWFGGPVILEP